MSGAADSPRSGAAREVPKGRLASFEDDAAPTFTLPPRPGQARTPALPEAEPEIEEVPAAENGPNEPAHRADAGDGLGEGDQASSIDQASDSTRTTAPAGPVGPVKASNVHIPADLLDAFNQAKATQNLSNGELIITAIEATYEELQRQLKPPTPTGGSLFAHRVTRPPRLPTTGPVTPLNYRLRADDYATLDRLVRDLGASSRSHLISEALRGYLSRTA